MKTVLALLKKNREEIGMFLFEEGEKIGSFGQNIYPCVNILKKSDPPN